MAASSEAKARLKIDGLLIKAGWRLLDGSDGKANVQLEQNVKLTKNKINALGDNFEKTQDGYVDYLLLNDKGYPLAVLEAKRSDKNPLDGKEQARRYAHGLHVRFVILSNGNLHYFWDLDNGDPELIVEFPTQQSLQERVGFKPNHERLYEGHVDKHYIVSSQRKDIALRDYQLRAIGALQAAARAGKQRYLFEMATGTGKTLLSAAVIKLFLRSRNAKRVLFLVDRLELEEQAHKNFTEYLKGDYQTVIYKQHRGDWHKAEIVISTVQSMLAGDRYRKEFSPTDFDLLISDEAHRSLGGNSRAVFEYFIGFKLGLTATPRDYLKNIDALDLSERDQRKWERRLLLDTYTTFGCEDSEPTFKYSLIDGVRDGHLINPVVVDARTEITTQLLSDKGYSVMATDTESGEEGEQVFRQRDFEKKFFSQQTNEVFCASFLKHAERDPLSGEIGKSLIFCVSQSHASKIAQVLNSMAQKLWPDKYRSDFAVQVTSNIDDAQQMTINFANNRLNGHTQFLDGYKSSRTRVCVTVGMMTTGYDCQDILNVCLMRPVFSPTEFVQMKGRGTRLHTFMYRDSSRQQHEETKKRFKLFDFFANCEFFEQEFNYDEPLKLPALRGNGDDETDQILRGEEVTIDDPDALQSIAEVQVGAHGMRVDRELWSKASAVIAQDTAIKQAVQNDMWDRAVGMVRERYEDKPELYLTLDKIRRSENLDRRVTWREVLQRVFGLTERFTSRDELLEEEFQKFIAIYKPDDKHLPYIKNFMSAYIMDEEFRKAIDTKQLTYLFSNASFDMNDWKALNSDTQWQTKIPQHIKNYVNLNLFME